MLEEYKHPQLGLDLVQLEADLITKHGKSWNKDQSLIENIRVTEGDEFLKQLQAKMTAYRNDLLVAQDVVTKLLGALEGSPLLLPEILSPA
tara:strand:- start:9165 stop:9437 length:273 start_codon:yes stop_codon:yes gene_type:complete